MTTYNTGNPIGSKDPRDLYDNAENLDEAVNTRQAESWDDRLGVARKTWWGMEQDFQQFLIDSGYVGLGPNGEIQDYAPGLEITARNQVFRYDGELYRAGSSLELPYTTTGDWATEGGLFVGIGDALLRQELGSEVGGSYLVSNSVIVCRSIDDLKNTPSPDSLIDPKNHIFRVLDYKGGWESEGRLPSGGGYFRYDKNSVEDVDGGVVIDSANGSGRFIRVLNGFISPEFYGGGLNSLIDAAAASVKYSVVLRTGPNKYYLDTSFEAPLGLVWESEKTHVIQNSDRADAAGFAPSSNTVHTGYLKIEMGEYPGPGVGRAAVKIDDTQNRVPTVNNVSIGTIEILGGHDNANGVAALGGASNIFIDRIICPHSSKYGRAFMAHWGNFQDHYYDSEEGVYKHVEDALPTTHPNNIHIGSIDCGDLTFDDGDVAAAFISAGYDISIGSVKANVQSDSQTASIVTVSAGDLGFSYSNLLSVRSRNINIGSINGSSRGSAYREIGRALYADFDSTPQPSSLYEGRLQVSVDKINASGSDAGGVGNNGVILTNNGGSTTIKEIVGRGFNYTVFAGNRSDRVSIGNVISINSRGNALHFRGYGSNPDLFPKNYSVGKLTLMDYGRQSGGDNLLRKGVLCERIFSVDIGEIVIDVKGSGLDAVHSNTTGGGGGISIGKIFVNDPLFDQTYLITNLNPPSDPMMFGDYYDRSGNVVRATNGGIFVESNGRYRIFAIAGSPVPSGIRVSVGDRIVSQSSPSGTPLEWYVTESGITGSTASVVVILSRP